MRIIAKRTLKEFWELHNDSEEQLTDWYHIVSSSYWESPHQIKEVYPNADNVGNNRIVFNICHNKYRLIVVFRYKIQMAYIRFIGTHKEYDKIKNIKNI
jgi:mRNA interferase HigB